MLLFLPIIFVCSYIAYIDALKFIGKDSLMFLPFDDKFSRILSTQFNSLYVMSFYTSFSKIIDCFSSSISDKVWFRYSNGIFEINFLMFIFSFNPINKNELNYFLAWSPGKISGVKLGVSS